MHQGARLYCKTKVKLSAAAENKVFWAGYWIPVINQKNKSKQKWRVTVLTM